MVCLALQLIIACVPGVFLFNNYYSIDELEFSFEAFKENPVMFGICLFAFVVILSISVTYNAGALFILGVKLFDVNKISIIGGAVIVFLILVGAASSDILSGNPDEEIPKETPAIVNINYFVFLFLGLISVVEYLFIEKKKKVIEEKEKTIKTISNDLITYQDKIINKYNDKSNSVTSFWH